MEEPRNAKLVRDIPVRLLDVSLSGCRIAANHPIVPGTRGELRTEVDGKIYRDGVEVTRMMRHQGCTHTFTLACAIAFGNRPGTASVRGEVPSPTAPIPS